MHIHIHRTLYIIFYISESIHYTYYIIVETPGLSPKCPASWSVTVEDIKNVSDLPDVDPKLVSTSAFNWEMHTRLCHILMHI